MTTSILDANEFRKLLGETKTTESGASLPTNEELPKSVSLDELIDRLRGVLTAEEAESMERAINESCERLDD